MTVLIIIITLVLIGMFWRQILKGGLISIIILLILSLIAYFFFSYSAIAEKKIKDDLKLSHMLRCETNYDSRYVALLLEKYNLKGEVIEKGYMKNGVRAEEKKPEFLK